MYEQVDRLAGALVGDDSHLEREFETRLTESSTLAFRVAYSVLRHRQDAEHIAQDAFVRAPPAASGSCGIQNGSAPGSYGWRGAWPSIGSDPIGVASVERALMRTVRSARGR